MFRLAVIALGGTIMLSACGVQDWTNDPAAESFDLSQFGDVQTQFDEDLREQIERAGTPAQGAESGVERCTNLSFREDLNDPERLLIRCNPAVYFVAENGVLVEMRTSSD